MSEFEPIHLKCQRGHEFQVACVGFSEDYGYFLVDSDEEAAKCSEIVWGVYVRDPDDGFFSHIEDHPTRETALEAAQRQIEVFNKIAKMLHEEAP